MVNPEWLPAIHVHLYACNARAGELPSSESILINGVELPTIQCEDLSQSRFSISFEQAAEGLQQLDRFYFEPDGSFAWAGSTEPINNTSSLWQLYGMLYDYGGRLQRVEVQGACPLEAWRSLLRVLDDKRQTLIAQIQVPVCLVAARSLEKLWEPTHA
ncbi:MAG: hypothetical protein R3C53_13685 [Pirellulaceae bacterium]